MLQHSPNKTFCFSFQGAIAGGNYQGSRVWRLNCRGWWVFCGFRYVSLDKQVNCLGQEMLSSGSHFGGGLGIAGLTGQPTRLWKGGPGSVQFPLLCQRWRYLCSEKNFSSKVNQSYASHGSCAWALLGWCQVQLWRLQNSRKHGDWGWSRWIATFPLSNLGLVSREVAGATFTSPLLAPMSHPISKSFPMWCLSPLQADILGLTTLTIRNWFARNIRSSSEICISI